MNFTSLEAAMSFKDIIKKSVFTAFDAGDLDAGYILIVLCTAAVLGIFIYMIYRISTRNGFYNQGFGKTLAALPVITAGIMLAMQSNLVISLGMVGALSIVRFRNAVKDSVDLTYLFWSISIGIIIGAGFMELGLLLSLAMTVLLFGMDLLPARRPPYLLIVSGEKTASEEALLNQVRSFTRSYKVRSRNVSAQGTDWILELRVKDGAGLVRSVSQITDILSVNLMSHDGDVRY